MTGYTIRAEKTRGGRVERRTGELLKVMKKSGERRSGHGSQRKKAGSRDVIPKKELKDFGISLNQSARWQKVETVVRRRQRDELIVCLPRAIRYPTRG